VLKAICPSRRRIVVAEYRRTLPSEAAIGVGLERAGGEG